jgi:hypothetical protein
MLRSAIAGIGLILAYAVSASPVLAAPANEDCDNCAPPKTYDSTEVVKTSRDVDQSRVINTEEVVQVRPRVKETNHLVIHKNETRNVGVIQHNHKIIEKEIRYVKRAPVYQHYAPRYRVRLQTVYVPIVMQSARPCGCPCTCYASQSAYAQADAYGGGYTNNSQRGAVQQVLVPVTVPAGYGYR